MSRNVTAVVQTTIQVNAALLAGWFCDMNDEEQAQFFIEVARIANGWSHDGGYQWHLVGRHLATCECSTAAARDMVRDIATAAHTADAIEEER